MLSKVFCLVLAASVTVPTIVSAFPQNANAEWVTTKICARNKTVYRTVYVTVNGKRKAIKKPYEVCAEYVNETNWVGPVEQRTSTSADSQN
jgi:hypothetical protein